MSHRHWRQVHARANVACHGRPVAGASSGSERVRSCPTRWRVEMVQMLIDLSRLEARSLVRGAASSGVLLIDMPLRPTLDRAHVSVMCNEQGGHSRRDVERGPPMRAQRAGHVSYRCI